MSEPSSLRKRIENAAEDLEERDGVIHRPDGLKYLSPVRARAFLGLVRVGNKLDYELNAELEAEHGLSLRAFEVLLFLAVFSGDGWLSMSELTNETPLSQSRVSRLVAELERRGLVERGKSDTDARGVTVTITAKGTQRFRAAQDTHLAGLEKSLFSHLSEAEISQLATTAAKLLDADA